MGGKKPCLMTSAAYWAVLACQRISGREVIIHVIILLDFHCFEEVTYSREYQQMGTYSVWLQYLHTLCKGCKILKGLFCRKILEVWDPYCLGRPSTAGLVAGEWQKRVRSSKMFESLVQTSIYQPALHLSIIAQSSIWYV